MTSYRNMTAAMAVLVTVLLVPAIADAQQSRYDRCRRACSDLAQQTEEERAFALIFYYGYLAGRSDAKTIDSSRVSEQLLQVRNYCNAHPDSAVIDAFVAALK